MTKTLVLALIGMALAAPSALAADSKEKKEAQKVAPAKNKAADKGSQGGIILQDNATTASKNKAADKGAKGGIILQDNATTASKNKAADKGAKGGIILQDNAGKSTNLKAPAGKSATPGG